MRFAYGLGDAIDGLPQESGSQIITGSRDFVAPE